MSKNRFRATIAGGVLLAGLLAGGGVVYATTNGPDGSNACSVVPSLSKAVGPTGRSSADASTDAESRPPCVAPVAPAAPISH